MVIIIKPAQQANKSHHTIPTTTTDSAIALKNSKVALLFVADTVSMVWIYGK